MHYSSLYFVTYTVFMFVWIYIYIFFLNIRIIKIIIYINIYKDVTCLCPWKHVTSLLNKMYDRRPRDFWTLPLNYFVKRIYRRIRNCLERVWNSPVRGFFSIQVQIEYNVLADFCPREYSWITLCNIRKILALPCTDFWYLLGTQRRRLVPELKCDILDSLVSFFRSK